MSDATRGPIVTVAGGELEGRSAGGVTAFLGIPYAAAPFGANRMRPPQPHAPWSGIRSAFEYGPTVPKAAYPPQLAVLVPEVDIAGEDCLNLNVWTPDTPAAGRPVFVWIHGGAFTNGSGSVAEYDGSAFARDGIVCVTINYRLGAEGFLSLGDGGANLGLLDQIAALRWVQDNIAAFGGDPTKVTVGGESAGAMSVTTLLAMPMAAGLFTRAITQSGAGSNYLTPDQAGLVAGYLADSLGIEPVREAFARVPVDTLAQAAADLFFGLQANPDPQRWGMLALSLTIFAPTVDGEVLPSAPLEAIAAGSAGDVALLTGVNREEMRLFLVPGGIIDFIDDPTLEAAAGGYGLSPEGLGVYRANRAGESPGEILAAVAGDWLFRIPCLRVAEARDGRAPTWVYRFDHTDRAANGGLGVCHSVEVPYVFDTIDCENTHSRIGSSPSPAVAQVMHGAWVAFIAGGDPSWAPYTSSQRTTALITEEIVAADDPDAAERVQWDGRR